MKQRVIANEERCEWLGPFRFHGYQEKCGRRAVRFYLCHDGTVSARCKGHVPPGVPESISQEDWSRLKIVSEIMTA